jgi:positive regulator of sigma E activity
MKNWHTYLLVLIARFIVIGFFSFIYITPLFILFYLIIFNNLSLLNEITLKYYLISYCVGFCIVYNNTMKEDEKDDKPINKGV